MKNLPALGLLLALLGCEHQQTASVKKVVPASPPNGSTVSSSQPVAAALDTVQRPLWVPAEAADTVLQLDGQLCRLRMESVMDSSRLLKGRTEYTPGEVEMATGYDGRFTFILRDSAGRLLFRRQLRKADFYQQVDEVVVAQCPIYKPVFMGYSAPLGALVFALTFVVDGTEWGSDVLVLLSLQGKVLRMAGGYDYGGGPSCHPGLSADGRALLTSTEVIRAGRPPLTFGDKPGAELRGVFLLDDSTLVTIYEAVAPVPKRNSVGGIIAAPVASPARKKQPNAFVTNINSGKVLSQFRYDGFYEILGYSVPRHYQPGTRTHYLLDEMKGLHLLPEVRPAAAMFRPFASMRKYTPPRQPSEARFEMNGQHRTYAFYVDTLAPARIRYQLLADSEPSVNL